MTRTIIFIFSHLLFAALGFAAGIYALPILTAPDAPSSTDVAAMAATAQFTGEFRRDLTGSDALHWGEGTISVGPRFISLQGKIAPGPDYKLYLSPEFVQTEAEFEASRDRMVRIGDVRTFDNFIVAIPQSVDAAQFNSVIVWCESFGEFITAARYR